ncbi:MAG: hypothetical protein Ct9H90mP2_03130 [Dehalococcoidia bacterium]|nr:MAG: hypothetical protein Ct9H90mP2_03130 [Dehalococcoidia bacterium]
MLNPAPKSIYDPPVFSERSINKFLSPTVADCRDITLNFIPEDKYKSERLLSFICEESSDLFIRKLEIINSSELVVSVFSAIFVNASEIIR